MSKKPETQRRFRVVSALYLDPDPKTVQEIAEVENIDLRTVYKDVDAVADDLTPLIFGVDAVKVFSTRKR
jgi:predicted DNA-binding transcriptional regulator YafY